MSTSIIVVIKEELQLIFHIFIDGILENLQSILITDLIVEKDVVFLYWLMDIIFQKI